MAAGATGRDNRSSSSQPPGIFALTFLYAFDIIGFGLALVGLALGGRAAAVKTRLVEAPMVTAQTRPVMLEGWVTGVELGRRNERLNIRVHPISGYAAEQLPRHVRLTHMWRLEVSRGALRTMPGCAAAAAIADPGRRL